MKDVKAIINLVGQSVADQSWTKAYKEALYTSRIQSVKALYNAIKNLNSPPEMVLQASATGYYGF